MMKKVRESSSKSSYALSTFGHLLGDFAALPFIARILKTIINTILSSRGMFEQPVSLERPQSFHRRMFSNSTAHSARH
ncbi:uncharacterized protein PHALS_05937 [Plasmopara halstedii]|uniref:Uncharacterized protein n=1 Tax=Plasmopara halstedii TaxID=4781 RepID=A0A0P1ABG5_PLAHL|nr:uncharacterized protein PHALS_05937 [Plasmopara halstedii]CEG37888.1 hypothetical protein PHALS_05937 [Plasmopara halstedii]|eukprot:XP_024574257.1 hypothetical protein PHALS_05937 [Plasmopara halstedii]